MRPQLSQLTPSQREEMLRENWNSHDARWYLKTAQEFGFEAANRLNHNVIRSMGKTEIRRLAQALGVERVSDLQEFLEIFDMMMELCFPQQVYQHRIEHQKCIRGKVTRCFVAEMVRLAGGADVYDCSCGARFEGWFAGLDLKVKAYIEKSIVRGDPACEILLNIE